MNTELAARAVKCKGWRWMDGMRALDGDRSCGFRLTENSGLPGHPEPVVDDSWTPDLADPATLGCLLALVREAWGAEHVSVTWLCPGYEADVQTRDREGLCAHIATGPTEAAALVAALEAAP